MPPRRSNAPAPTLPQAIVDTLVRGGDVGALIDNAYVARFPATPADRAELSARAWDTGGTVGEGAGGIVWYAVHPRRADDFPRAVAAGVSPGAPLCVKATDMGDTKHERVREALDDKPMRAIAMGVADAPPTLYADVAVSEMLIGSLLSHLFTSGASPHLVALLHTAPVADQMYALMERVGRRVSELRPPKRKGARGTVAYRHRSGVKHLAKVAPAVACTSEVIADIVVTVLFTLGQLQDAFGIVHHDVSLENVWCKSLCAADDAVAGADAPTAQHPPYLFQGRDLCAVRWFAYRFRGAATFWVPNRGVLLKLGDAGNAIATRLPLVDGRARTIAHDILQRSLRSSQGIEWRRTHGITADMKPGYDAHYFLPQLAELAKAWRVAEPPELARLHRRYSMPVSSETERPREGRLLRASPRDMLLEHATTVWARYTTPPSPMPADAEVLYVDDLAGYDASRCLLPTG